MKSGPKEDPEDKKDRVLQRRTSLLDRRDAAERNAGGLTGDLQAVYGIQSLFNFGKVGTKAPAGSSSRSSSVKKPVLSQPDANGK